MLKESQWCILFVLPGMKRDYINLGLKMSEKFAMWNRARNSPTPSGRLALVTNDNARRPGSVQLFFSPTPRSDTQSFRHRLNANTAWWWLMR